MDERFRKVEEEYFLLRGQVQFGRISREQFEARLKELLVQDTQGRYWMLGVNDGNWYRHDGTSWLQATPPETAMPVTTVAPAPITATTAAPVAPTSMAATAAAPRSEPRPAMPGPVATVAAPHPASSRHTWWLVISSAILGAGVAAFFSTLLLTATLPLTGSRQLGPVGLAGCPLALVFLLIVIVQVRRFNRA